MDYDSDSSDFHFPSDTGLPTLTSPLSHKLPQVHDWAMHDFMQTKSIEQHNFVGFKQFMPVMDNNEEEDDYFLTLEEKDFLTQLSTHFIQLERKELHDVLKGGFMMVQNDVQANQQQHLKEEVLGLSWFHEAVDYGHYQIDNLDTVQLPKRKNNFSPFKENEVLPTTTTTTLVAPVSPEPLTTATNVLPSSIHNKPLPPLPTPKTTNKLKSKLLFVKPSFVKSTSEKPKKFFQSTKKFIRSILSSSNNKSKNTA
ncbi:MAG: hypothetical protein EXX96DRAFT_555888 [Benjaminiella poitrasii]|nr:MAG: hypothetical protein EXX96DRAFT_555888 [Benjaminiella poitrasii]